MYVYVANIWLHINIPQNEVLHLGLGLGLEHPCTRKPHEEIADSIRSPI